MDQMVAERIRRPLRLQAREDAHTRLALTAQTAESPPPSFRALCRRIDLDPTTANRTFPDLAATIKGRYQKYHADTKRKRMICQRTTVETAVQQLLDDGLTLSYKHLRAVLPPGTSTRDKRVRDEFRRQQEQL